MTARWARRCKRWREENIEHPTSNIQHRTTESEQSAIRTPQSDIERQLLFGIVQGATFEDLRRSSAQAIVDLDFDGYAIGGVSVGEPAEEMMCAVESSGPSLPEHNSRYALR